MSLQRCEMRCLRPPPADGQTRLGSHKVSYLPLLGTPRTYCISKNLSIEGPTSDQSVFCSRKHDVGVDGVTMRNFWGLCSLYLIFFVGDPVMMGSATHVADTLSYNLCTIYLMMTAPF